MDPRIMRTQNYSYEQPRSSRSFFLRIGFIFFLLICIVVTAAISLVRSSHFQFKEIQVYGAQTFPGTVVESFTRQYFSGTSLKVIPRSSTIFFSKDDFTEKLKNEFPIIDMAYVTFPEPTHIAIHVKERDAAMVWCFSAEACAFVDNQGIVYGKAPVFSEGVYPQFSSEIPKNYTDVVGKQIIEPAVMNRFVALTKKLQNDDMSLSRTVFLENGDIAFYIEKLFDHYPSDQAKILGTITQDDEVFIRDSVTGLNHESFKEQFIKSPKELEYIDLRFAGKIFYKFKNQEKPTEKESALNSD